jgi:hypothetical protein
MIHNRQISVRQMLKKIFNTNTGYFIKEVTYYFEGNYEIGYVLCKGYLMFGIPGYDVVRVYTDRTEAMKWQK